MLQTELSPEKPVSAREKKELQKLVEGIVLSQGNVFIKELLRERKIGIGATKKEFQEALHGAIDDGKLNKNHIEDWLNRVDGWGDQHVYLYRVPLATSQHPLWNRPDKIQERVKKAGLSKYWERQTSQEFPEERALTGIYFVDRCLRITWHQGLTPWARDESKDYQQRIDGDLYEFRAHRQRADRSVMRFEMRLDHNLAGAFIQEVLEESAHREALNEVHEVAAQVFDFSSLERLNIAHAVKGIDQAILDKEPNGKSIRANSTRLSSLGAYVQFASTKGDTGYQDNEPVRRVRRAVSQKDFRGDYGTFLFSRTGPRGAVQALRVQLYGGKQHRVRLRAQMTAAEVWEILLTVKKYAQ